MEVIRYLSLSLSPVIIIGVGVLILKMLKNKREQKHDES
jgi:hypothetical protein